MSEKILSRKEGQIGTITINNPERHNAMSLEMWEAVGKAVEDFTRDEGVRVVVVTGAGGKSFMSGADISKFESERSSAEGVARYNAARDATDKALAYCPKPTIAMIRGYCLGGGLGFALCCDLRICTDKSTFGIPAAKLGLGYGYEGVRKLTDLVGPSFAKEIFYTGRQFKAAEAETMGLVNRVLPDAEGALEAYVAEYSEMIAGNAPITVDGVKFIVSQTLKDPDKRDLGACDAWVQRAFTSDDYKEGRRAFMEKRKPNFTGT